MKKIAVLTATRAEYGLLRPVIRKLNSKTEIKVCLAVTGAHLSPEFGMTINEIKSDGIPVDKCSEILLSGDSPCAVSKTMGLAMISFAEYFDECSPDALIVLGDRYETLAVCCAAVNARIPIFHLHGGETTEGAVDEAYRHAITKMSYLHFTSTEEYRRRVIRMGEAPGRVFCVGAIGVENAKDTPLLSQIELEERLGLSHGERFAVGTFHPVTLENATAEIQIRELLKAVEKHNDIRFVFTKANADADGRVINKILAEYAADHEGLILEESLGTKVYLSALSKAVFVIGNSSSGLIEAPFYKIPTINIGDRQKGRTAGETVINCKPECEDIDKAINKALSEEFRSTLSTAQNPYGDGDTSEKIVSVIMDYMSKDRIEIKKKFYDGKQDQ